MEGGACGGYQVIGCESFGRACVDNSFQWWYRGTRCLSECWCMSQQTRVNTQDNRTSTSCWSATPPGGRGGGCVTRTGRPRRGGTQSTVSDSVGTPCRHIIFLYCNRDTPCHSQCCRISHQRRGDTQDNRTSTSCGSATPPGGRGGGCATRSRHPRRGGTQSTVSDVLLIGVSSGTKVSSFSENDVYPGTQNNI